MTDENSSDKKNVALIGHCGPDAWMLKSMVRRSIADADVQMINSQSDFEAAIGNLDLLLVNRVLDGDFEDESGIELIRTIAQSEGAHPPALLISNFEDAQAAAEEAGAKPGFGKSDLNSDDAAKRLRDALAS